MKNIYGPRHLKQMFFSGMVIWWMPLVALLVLIFSPLSIFVTSAVLAIFVGLSVLFVFSPSVRVFCAHHCQEYLFLFSRDRIYRECKEELRLDGVEIVWKKENPFFMGPINAIRAVALLPCHVMADSTKIDGWCVAFYDADKDFRNTKDLRWSKSNVLIKGDIGYAIDYCADNKLIPDKNTPKETAKWIISKIEEERAK